MTAPGVRRDRRGFALAMVVFLLFTVAVAGATGYQVVSSEFALARQNRDGQQALAVARAGMSRYLGESVGSVADTVLYAIGNGVATVTAKRVLRQDSLSYLYYIESTGEVDDIRTPLLPARRTVGTYAWHRMSPIRLKGAVWVSGGATTLGGGFGYGATVSGSDAATTSDCSGGGTAGVRGLVKGSGTWSVSSGSALTGPAPTTSTYSGYAAYYDTVGVRWDILSSASFPVDFDGTPPNWGSIPADSFPIVRKQGTLNADWTWSGRGVLIVTGTLNFASTWDPSSPSFSWDGIVLAGALGNMSSLDYPAIRGMLIGGLNAANGNARIRGDIRYHSCNAYKANRSLSYLEVVDNTLFEVNR